MAAFPEDYLSELSAKEHSGPHPIDDERRDKNKEVYAGIQELLPIDDIHMVSTCDLIYKFLIALRWDTAKTIEVIREYVAWRKEQKLNDILWEEFPAELVAETKSGYHGRDREGHPVYYDRPDPTAIKKMVGQFPRETLLRYHFVLMEIGRRAAVESKADRVTCVVDCSNVSMGIIMNPTAIGFLKEISKLDQRMYPENMRHMLLLNTPWSFNTLWKIIRPLLDERVQKKIQFLSGKRYLDDMDKYIALSEVPEEFGGRGGAWQHANDNRKLLLSLPIATRPVPGKCMISGEPAAEIAPVAVVASPAEGELPYDSEDFQSFPSSDESASSLQSPREATDASPPRAPSDPGCHRIPFKVQSSQGASFVEGYDVKTGEPFARTSGNVVMGVGAKETMLLGEFVLEAGHPLHMYLMVLDALRQVRYILKRRNIHKQVQIFVPKRSDAGVRMKKNKCVCDSDRDHAFTAKVAKKSSSKLDWDMWPHGDKTHLMGCRRGNDFLFYGTLSLLPKDVLFALGASLLQMWHEQDEV